MKPEAQVFSISACFPLELSNLSSASVEEGEEM